MSLLITIPFRKVVYPVAFSCPIDVNLYLHTLHDIGISPEEEIEAAIALLQCNYYWSNYAVTDTLKNLRKNDAAMKSYCESNETSIRDHIDSPGNEYFERAADNLIEVGLIDLTPDNLDPILPPDDNLEIGLGIEARIARYPGLVGYQFEDALRLLKSHYPVRCALVAHWGQTYLDDDEIKQRAIELEDSIILACQQLKQVPVFFVKHKIPANMKPASAFSQCHYFQHELIPCGLYIGANEYRVLFDIDGEPARINKILDVRNPTRSYWGW